VVGGALIRCVGDECALVRADFKHKSEERLRRVSLDEHSGALGFRLDVLELAPTHTIARDGYAICAYETEHRGRALGYVLTEEEQRGPLDPRVTQPLGAPGGASSHSDRSPVPSAYGDAIRPIESFSSARPASRRVVVTGDTRPSAATVAAACDADVLVHEATFCDDEATRAAETGHSTAREAATVAVQAAARTLILTHISARYSHNASTLQDEARAVFAGATVARDGMRVDVPYPERTGVGDRVGGGSREERTDAPAS